MGRPSKEAELSAFAEHIGVELTRVHDFIGAAAPVKGTTKKPPALTPDELGEPPERFEDWLPEMRRILWSKIHDFDGVAAVQAQKLIKELVKMEREDEGPDLAAEERRPLLDRAESLPSEEAARLIKQEIARSDAYQADLFAALERLEAA
jgi:hypothetical protein